MNETSSSPLLSLRNLTIALPKGADRAYAVEDVSYDVKRGEILCVVGESGSGKSMAANAIMGLLPKGVRPVDGEALFDGQDLLTLTEKQHRQLRGLRIGMIFQEPMTALNPLMRVGAQTSEVFEAHGRLSGRERQEKALALLIEVGIPQPEKAIRAYPFQLSGGQRQRIGIARALALKPELIVADEAVSALDVSIQAQILELLEELKQKLSLSLLFITHDLRVAAQICDRIIVMQHGRIVEQGPARDVFLAPQQAYTRQLLEAIPGRPEALESA